MSEELKKTDIKKIAVRGCLIVAGILFLIFLCRYNQIKKESLYDTEGRTFAKATVMNVLQDNETKDGIYIGRQLVKLKITSGKWKGTGAGRTAEFWKMERKNNGSRQLFCIFIRSTLQKRQ